MGCFICMTKASTSPLEPLLICAPSDFPPSSLTAGHREPALWAGVEGPVQVGQLFLPPKHIVCVWDCLWPHRWHLGAGRSHPVGVLLDLWAYQVVPWSMSTVFCQSWRGQPETENPRLCWWGPQSALGTLLPLLSRPRCAHTVSLLSVPWNGLAGLSDLTSSTTLNSRAWLPVGQAQQSGWALPLKSPHSARALCLSLGILNIVSVRGPAFPFFSGEFRCLGLLSRIHPLQGVFDQCVCSRSGGNGTLPHVDSSCLWILIFVGQSHLCCCEFFLFLFFVFSSFLVAFFFLIHS